MLYSICCLKLPFMGFRDDNIIRIVQTKAEKEDGKSIGPNTVEVFSGYGKIG